MYFPAASSIFRRKIEIYGAEGAVENLLYMSVLIPPGAMQFTVIFLGPKLYAKLRTTPRIAAFDVE